MQYRRVAQMTHAVSRGTILFQCYFETSCGKMSVIWVSEVTSSRPLEKHGDPMSYCPSPRQSQFQMHQRAQIMTTRNRRNSDTVIGKVGWSATVVLFADQGSSYFDCYCTLRISNQPQCNVWVSVCYGHNGYNLLLVIIFRLRVDVSILSSCLYRFI